VFEHYDQAERDRLFGKPPATVFETLRTLDADEEGRAVLLADGVFEERTIASYSEAMRTRWLLELSERILSANMDTVRECRRIHAAEQNEVVNELWGEVEALRRRLMQDSRLEPSLFSRVREAIARRDEAEVSALQQEMNAQMDELRYRYVAYTRNVLDPLPNVAAADSLRLFSAVAASGAEV
jgi:glutamine synthetase